MSGIIRAFAVYPIMVLLSCAAPGAQAPQQDRLGVPIQFAQQRTNVDCLKAVGGNQTLCEGAGSKDNIIETASIDIDGDGDLDLVVRRLSAVTCGSHGCSTDIYLNTGNGLTIAEPRLVTAGPLSHCKTGSARGLRASTAASAPCILFSSGQ